MTNGAWGIDYLDAYGAWVLRHRPGLADETELLAWLVNLEQTGPPSVPTDTKGNGTATGPSGTPIYFRRFDSSGGRGYVLIMRIG